MAGAFDLFRILLKSTCHSTLTFGRHPESWKSHEKFSLKFLSRIWGKWLRELWLYILCIGLDYVAHIDIGHVDFLETVHKQAEKPYVIVGLHFDQVRFIKTCTPTRFYRPLHHHCACWKGKIWCRKLFLIFGDKLIGQKTSCEPGKGKFKLTTLAWSHTNLFYTVFELHGLWWNVFQFSKMQNTIHITVMVTTVKLLIITRKKNYNCL